LLFVLRSILTYLLTLWCRVLLEKLTGLQLVKKFPAFHETGRFNTALTSARHPEVHIKYINKLYGKNVEFYSVYLEECKVTTGF